MALRSNDGIGLESPFAQLPPTRQQSGSRAAKSVRNIKNLAAVKGSTIRNLQCRQYSSGFQNQVERCQCGDGGTDGEARLAGVTFCNLERMPKILLCPRVQLSQKRGVDIMPLHNSVKPESARDWGELRVALSKGFLCAIEPKCACAFYMFSQDS